MARSICTDNWITQPRAECDILRREYGITVEQPELFSPKWNLPATVRLMFHYEITKIYNDDGVDLDSPVRENTKGFEPFGFHALNNFESMLNDETTADVVIKTTLGKEKSFNCHKFILAGKNNNSIVFSYVVILYLYLMFIQNIRIYIQREVKFSGQCFSVR